MTEESLRVLVRNQRLAKNLRQIDLGDKAGVSQQTICAFESGKGIALCNFVWLAQVLGIASLDLFPSRFGENIERERKSQCLSFRELAIKCGNNNKNHFYRVEKKQQSIRLKTALQICNGLEVSLWDMLR